jgi:hypothetical protein
MPITSTAKHLRRYQLQQMKSPESSAHFGLRSSASAMQNHEEVNLKSSVLVPFHTLGLSRSPES